MNKTGTNPKKVKSKNGLHPLVLIVAITLFVMLLTYIVPAGKFERVLNEATNKTVVVPGSFTQVEQAPVSIGKFLISFQKGFVDSAAIVGFLLLIGGGFGIVNGTGAIEALMAKFIVRFKSDKSKELLIFMLVLFFASCAAVFGMAMESLVFAPFLMSLMIAFKYDALLGVAIPCVGVAIGYGAAFINPFNIGIAQQIAELTPLSGMGFRMVFFVICVSVTGYYFIRYARKISKNPQLSACVGKQYDLEEIKNPEAVELTSGHKRVLVIFVASIGVLIYGSMFKNFFMNECATVFLVMGVLAGFAYGLKLNEIAESFVKGAKDLTMAALLVAFARAIIIVLESGMIIDTVIYYATLPLLSIAPILSAPLMVVVQTFINLFINSGSGQAVATMPIMVPAADLLGINRQVAVLAFQIGDGFSNMFWFTSGTLMVALGMAKVSYSEWLKFIGKLFGILLVLGMVAVSLAQFINLT